jgi:hypothetical protein
LVAGTTILGRVVGVDSNCGSSSIKAVMLSAMMMSTCTAWI